VQILTSGHGLVESPRWHDDRLWFADWTAGHVNTIDADGTCTTVVTHPSMPLCFDFLPEGDLVLASGMRGALLRVVDGELVDHADLSHLSTHGSNDIVIDRRGNAYVNNINADFGALTAAGEPAPGFVALATPDGRARVVADDMAFPNGMTLLDGGRTLVVAESYRGRLTAFDVTADGSLEGRRVWADVPGHFPDGICADADGAIWYADVASQVCVRVAEGGERLAVVELDRGAFACTLGWQAGRPTLFVVAAHWPGPEGLATHTNWDGAVFATAAPAPAAASG
jgi:sugar lactone lactonase YvrE